MNTDTPTGGHAAQLAFALPATPHPRDRRGRRETSPRGDLVPARSPWLDVDGPSGYLGMTPDAVRKAAQRGFLPPHQPFGKGSRYFFHYRELDEYLLAAEVAGVDAATGSRT